MSRSTPVIPPWIRQFRHPGYLNVYSFDQLRDEPKLFCTETLFGDWDAPTLLLAKDAAPAHVIRQRIEDGDPNPWRHGVRGLDPMGYKTNERVAELAQFFRGSKLYGSALAHMLKEDEKTSGSLAHLTSGRLADHLRRVLRFVVDGMPNLQTIVCLGNEAHRLVSSCTDDARLAALTVGGSVEVSLYGPRILVARLYHPSRPFTGGWAERRKEWQAVANEINARISPEKNRYEEELPVRLRKERTHRFVSTGLSDVKITKKQSDKPKEK